MDREAWRAATHGAAGSEAAEPSCLSGEARPAPCGPLPPPRPRFRQRLPASARVAPVGIPQLRGVGWGSIRGSALCPRFLGRAGPPLSL